VAGENFPFHIDNTWTSDGVANPKTFFPNPKSPLQAQIDNTWTSEGESSLGGGSNGVEGLSDEAGNESPIHRSSKAVVAIASGLAAPSADVNPKP
jgi:hypothetical protein